MPRPSQTPPSRIPHEEALLQGFRSGGRPREDWLVGGEFERHLLQANGLPAPFLGERGIRWLLDAMGQQGWTPLYEGDHPVALRNDGASVTLEPGSQLELSSAPYPSLKQIDAESRAFTEQVEGLIRDVPLFQVGLGHTPFATIRDIPWVPKGRYVIMREHLARTGRMAHSMMKGTCAIQVSVDFFGEEDCARKVRTSTLLGPLFTAMYANSPLVEGRPSDWMSTRGHIWTHTDPHRTGFPDAALAFSFERWLDYLLDVPLLFTFIGGVWRHGRGVTFRQWLHEGIEGIHPTWDDWDLHLTSVFPEIRIKNAIEIRGADGVPRPLALSFCALLEGLLYDDDALGHGLELAERFGSHGTVADRFDEACRHGLEGRVGGLRLSSWAEALVEIAQTGLRRWREEDAAYLDPLVALVSTGRSRAARVLEAWQRDPSPQAVLDASRYAVDADPLIG